MAASNPITTDQQVVCIQDSHPVLVEIPDAVGLLASGEGQVRDAQGALVYSVALAADQGAGHLSGEIPAAETATWSPGRYTLGIRATYTTGSVLTVAQITLDVIRGPVR